MSPELHAHGVSVSPPAGFEGRVFRRPGHGEIAAAAADGPAAPPGEIPNTVVHVSTIALPPDTGDFASGAVELLDHDDVLVVMFEYDAASAGQPLFARQGMPRSLTPEEFSPSMLQRMIKGQAGCQIFFTENGRPFCVYAVIGSYARRNSSVEKVNAVLATVRIDARVDRPEAATSAPTTSTAPPTTVPPTTSSPATTPPPATLPSTTTPSTTTPGATSP